MLDTGQGEPGPVEHVPGLLGVVQPDRGGSVGEVVGERLLVLRILVGEVDRHRVQGAVVTGLRVKQRQGVGASAEGRSVAGDRHSERTVDRSVPAGTSRLPAGVGGQPLPQRAVGDLVDGDLDVVAVLELDPHGAEGAVAQVVAELQVIEDLHGTGRFDGAGTQRRQGIPITVEVTQVQVTDHLGDLACQLHIVDVVPQGLADLAAEVVEVLQYRVQAAVFLDPLLGGLRPHTRDTGHVVGGVTAQRGQIRVLRGGDPVLLLHPCRGEPVEFGDPSQGVEHCHIIIDQLQAVAVTRADHGAHPGLGTADRQGGDDVVGLVGLLGQGGDTQ